MSVLRMLLVLGAAVALVLLADLPWRSGAGPAEIVAVACVTEDGEPLEDVRIDAWSRWESVDDSGRRLHMSRSATPVSAEGGRQRVAFPTGPGPDPTEVTLVVHATSESRGLVSAQREGFEGELRLVFEEPAWLEVEVEGEAAPGMEYELCIVPEFGTTYPIDPARTNVVGPLQPGARWVHVISWRPDEEFHGHGHNDVAGASGPEPTVVLGPGERKRVTLPLR